MHRRKKTALSNQLIRWKTLLSANSLAQRKAKKLLTRITGQTSNYKSPRRQAHWPSLTIQRTDPIQTEPPEMTPSLMLLQIHKYEPMTRQADSGRPHLLDTIVQCHSRAHLNWYPFQKNIKGPCIIFSINGASWCIVPFKLNSPHLIFNVLFIMLKCDIHEYDKSMNP